MDEASVAGQEVREPAARRSSSGSANRPIGTVPTRAALRPLRIGREIARACSGGGVTGPWAQRR